MAKLTGFEQFANVATIRTLIVFEFAIGPNTKGNLIAPAAQQTGSFFRCGLGYLGGRIRLLGNAGADRDADGGQPKIACKMSRHEIR